VTDGKLRRLLVPAILLTTLLAGILAGMAVERVWIARRIADRFPSAEERLERRSRLYDELGVTVEQRERLDRIFDRRGDQARVTWETARRDLVAVVDSASSEIRAVLTPLQREEYDRITAERRERYEGWRRRVEDRAETGPGPGPSDP
jgi:Spy/CpxP family protein refolding chaperone